MARPIIKGSHPRMKHLLVGPYDMTYSYDRTASTDVTAAITLRENGGNVEVAGPYNEMVDINPKLKSRGFRWDPSKRVWWVDRSDLTDRQMAGVRVLIEGKPVKAPKVPKGKTLEDVVQEAEAKRQAELDDLFKKAVETDLLGFRFVLRRTRGVGLSGRTYPLSPDCRKAGGVWNSSDKAWEFSRSETQPKAFEALLKVVVKESELFRQTQAKVLDFVEGKHWPLLGLRISVISNVNGSTVVFGGNTREVHAMLKEYVAKIHFDGSSWSVLAYLTNQAELAWLFSKLDKLELAKQEESQEELKQESEPVAPRKRENAKGDNCARCGIWVPPGSGYIYRYIDEDDDDNNVWRVMHKDERTCEERLKEVREQEALVRDQARVQRELNKLIAKPENFVHGENLVPPGERIILTPLTGYGGGSWLVVEPDKRHVWYVQNNGADGDDWGSNNVQTGGAGALGWRASLTEELQVLVDAAAGKIAKTAYSYDRS